MILLPKCIAKLLPPLGTQEGKNMKSMVYVKFFTPDSNWTWYAMEFSPEDQIFFGYVIGFEKEFGYFSLADLQSARGPLGLKIERDVSFEPMSLDDIMSPKP